MATENSNLTIDVRAPSRLHFGLLALDPTLPRQFGGVGLMVRKPDVLVRLQPAKSWTATGRMADRALEYARRFLDRARERGLTDSVPPAHLYVVRVPRPHTGLGTGTQLGMAVARGLAYWTRQPQLPASSLAHLVGRGQRSAIGAWGFIHGGLVVDGGKRQAHDLSPMVFQAAFPADWRLVLIRPRHLEGLSGQREQQAFNHQLSIPRQVTAELCRLVMLGLIPAMLERDLPSFGEALHELQVKVGQCFASAQGGLWADPSLTPIVDWLRGQGIHGVGQSSWGPTLYALTPDTDHALDLASRLQQQFNMSPDELTLTEADNQGASVRVEGSPWPLIASTSHAR
ncbi:MAG: beta-RFAP synthase [Phycisphaeraceae bacterium]|nr:beta-RFAP synthase [Phycisphaeraceae bacterium]